MQAELIVNFIQCLNKNSSRLRENTLTQKTVHDKIGAHIFGDDEEEAVRKRLARERWWKAPAGMRGMVASKLQAEQ